MKLEPLLRPPNRGEAVIIDLTTLRPGRLVLVNGKQYARCAACNCVVRVDKPLIGSLHFCTTERS